MVGRGVVDRPEEILGIGVDRMHIDEMRRGIEALAPLVPFVAGEGAELPSGIASPRLGVGACIQRGKLEKTRPVGDTATPLRIALCDAATRISCGDVAILLVLPILC